MSIFRGGPLRRRPATFLVYLAASNSLDAFFLPECFSYISVTDSLGLHSIWAGFTTEFKRNSTIFPFSTLAFAKNRTSMAAGAFELSYDGRVLEDLATLDDYSIASEANLDLTVPLKGGQ